MKLAPDSVYDVAVQQAWLEDEAARGNLLDNWWRGFAFFKKGEPRAVRYRLEPLRQEEALPDLERREAYRAQGWTYVATTGKAFHIWRCGDPDAPELDTDPEVQAMAYDHLNIQLRLAHLLVWAICLGMALVVLMTWRPVSDPLTRIVEREWPWWQAMVFGVFMPYTMWELIHWDRVHRRFLRGLRAGVPAPRRRPYRLARLRAAVSLVLYTGFLAAQIAMLFRPDSRPFLPVETYGEPVPYVALADLRDPLALPVENWLTRTQWWVIQEEPGGGRTSERYYDLWLPPLAGPLTREAREDQGLQPIPAQGLDGAWWAVRDDGIQVLLVRLGGQVLGVYYSGGEDLRNHVDDYAALLAERGDRP